MQGCHITVLRQEAIEALGLKADGVYIDATFGGGGHSQDILAELGDSAKLFSYDKDENARLLATKEPFTDKRFKFKHKSFAGIATDMESEGLSGSVSGVLFDLGVSSFQLDNPERGFSFSTDGPLDMRMDTKQGFTAADWVNSTPEKELADTIFQYGDERFSRRIAKAIVKERKVRKITRTLQLAETVAGVLPWKHNGKHPATRTFQAIRIVVNNEFSDLIEALEASAHVLTEDGRLVVLSFHSGEDRIVKHFIRNFRIPAAQTQNHVARLLQVGRVQKAGDREISSNPRARSVKMRVAVKTYQ